MKLLYLKKQRHQRSIELTMKKILYILLLLVAGIQAKAQSFSVEAIPDTNQLMIGEQVKVNLRVTYRVDNGAVNVVFPTLYDTINEFV